MATDLLRATTLVLIRANKSRGGQWDADDYDVRDEAGRVVGRIMRHPQAPKDQPWFWTLVDGIKPSSTIMDTRRHASKRWQPLRFAGQPSTFGSLSRVRLEFWRDERRGPGTPPAAGPGRSAPAAQHRQHPEWPRPRSASMAAMRCK